MADKLPLTTTTENCRCRVRNLTGERLQYYSHSEVEKDDFPFPNPPPLG